MKIEFNAETLPDMLRMMRLSHDLNGVEVAEKVGISKGQLSRLESGDRNFSAEFLEAMPKAFPNLTDEQHAEFYYLANILPPDTNPKVRWMVATKVMDEPQPAEPSPVELAP